MIVNALFSESLFSNAINNIITLVDTIYSYESFFGNSISDVMTSLRGRD